MRHFSKILVGAVIGGLVVAVLGISPQSRAAEQDASETYRLLELFGDVFERVRADYVEEVSDEELVEAAIEGMLAHLDPHSTFLNRKKFRDTEVQNRGEFGGLGIEVTMENGYVKVVTPIDDTPAFRAGLEANDLITHLDGESVQGLTLSEAVERMRGPIDTDIKLTVRRGQTKTFDVTITRDKIVIQSVRSRIEGDVGYLRITNFNEQTDKGLERAVKRIRDELGDKLAGFVVDLRNNPGGLLTQSITVSDMFLEQGEIVSTRGRQEEDGSRYNATPGDIAEGLPLVVLINGGSASASEIVAGALQDHRRAVLLGTKTFGKASVQTIMPLGRNGAIKLTTGRYYTPSGRSIQAKGIDPDIEVPQARVEALDQGQRRSEADYRNALRNEDEQPAPNGESSEPEGEADAEEAPKAIDDFQLARALDLIRGVSLFRSRMVN